MCNASICPQPYLFLSRSRRSTLQLLTLSSDAACLARLACTRGTQTQMKLVQGLGSCRESFDFYYRLSKCRSFCHPEGCSSNHCRAWLPKR